jgi:hypothetical protein
LHHSALAIRTGFDWWLDWLKCITHIVLAN